MHEIAFTIGNLTIRSYGFMAAVGFLLGVWLVTLNREHAKMTKDQAGSVVFWGMIGGIVGARAFYVIQFFDRYRDNLWDIVRIDQGGLVFYGGFFLALAFIVIFCRRNKLSLPAVFDVFAPALAVAHACGRIGCFLNGCCYGGKTACALGVKYPAGSSAHRILGDSCVHPVQLYEAFGLLILFPLFFYLVRKKPVGYAMSIYIILYGLLRFSLEFFRADNPHINNLTPAQWIGVLLIPSGLALFFYFSRIYGRKTA